MLISIIHNLTLQSQTVHYAIEQQLFISICTLWTCTNIVVSVTFYFQIESDEKLKESVIKVKISGDGAKITRLTNFIIISFSILNAEDTVMSSKGMLLTVSVCIVYNLSLL